MTEHLKKREIVMTLETCKKEKIGLDRRGKKTPYRGEKSKKDIILQLISSFFSANEASEGPNLFDRYAPLRGDEPKI